VADIDIRRAHNMAHAAAKAAADRIADSLGRKFGLKGEWDGDVLRFQGTGVTGTLTVGPKELHVAATLGFLLKAMKGSIEQAVRRELDAILEGSPGRAGPAAAAEKAGPATKKKGSAPKKKGG
jgi:putative polyhydroxyalkanoate system protein